MLRLKYGSIFLFTLLASMQVVAQPKVDYEIEKKIEKNGARILTVKVEACSKCFFGDLDAVMLDLKEGRQELGLQLSVEPLPLSNTAYFGIAAEVTKDPEQGLGSYKVTIPATEKAVAFQVQLCTILGKDADKKPCSSTSIVELNEAMVPYRVNSSILNSSSAKPLNTDASFRPSPKVYFSQIFFSNKALAFGTTQFVLDSESLEMILAEQGVDVKTSKAIFSDYQKSDKILSSMPLGISETQLIMQLPYYDANRCMGHK